MFKNYVKIAFRNLIKHKSYSLINVIGLAVGIACLALIINYVRYELSYDDFHKNSDNIYRITGDSWATTQAPLSSALSDFYPGIINTVRIKKVNKVLLGYENRNFYESNVIFADPAIFNMFTFPLVLGDPQTALNDPYSVVITEETALKYFGDRDPIGKKINYDDRFDYVVTGVARNIPGNSHLKFDFVFSLNCASSVFNSGFFENRMNTVVYNYFEVNPGCNFEQLKNRLEDFTKFYLGKDYDAELALGSLGISYRIQPLKSIHLHSDLGDELEPNGSITSVYIFTAVAILILLIACINYVNLSTARYMNRLKEIGIRKIVGANRRQIVFQFISESILLSFMAIVIVTIVLKSSAPLLSSIPGQEEILAGSNYGFVLLLIGIALVTGLVSAIFPALFISRFHPVFLLSKKLLRANKRFSFASFLIVFQFVVSTVLIIATLIINNQLSYLQNKRLGFNKEQVVIVPLQDRAVVQKHKVFKQDLLLQAGIVNVSASSVIPGEFIWCRSFGWEGKDPEEDNRMDYIKADEDFLNTYQISLVQGRGFSDSLSADTSLGFIINKAAMAKLGWNSPVGKSMETFNKRGFVIGVVDNFHYESFHKKIEPLVLYYDSNSFEYLSISINTTNVAETLDKIENRWSAYFPNKPYKYYFLDEYWGKLYRKEQNMNSLFSSFTGLAIFIACLGLFGLAAFSAQNKTKEIGIRKVLGASVPSLFVLQANEFIKWILLSFIFAFPIAWYIMNRWLDDFAYRIDITWWVFVLAGAIALVITLAAVSFHAVKAASADPVESLKYE